MKRFEYLITRTLLGAAFGYIIGFPLGFIVANLINPLALAAGLNNSGGVEMWLAGIELDWMRLGWSFAIIAATVVLLFGETLLSELRRNRWTDFMSQSRFNRNLAAALTLLAVVVHHLVPGVYSRPGMRPNVVPGVSEVIDLSAGAEHTCALTRKGEVTCWGGVALDRGPASVPLQRIFLSRPMGQLVPGTGESSCALRGQELACWKFSSDGPTYSAPIAEARDFELVARSEYRMGGKDLYVRKRSGQVISWHDSCRATEITWLKNARKIRIDGAYACAERERGDVICWRGPGVSECWQDSKESTAATSISGVIKPIELSVRYGGGCAIDAKNQGWCWRVNLDGKTDVGPLNAGDLMKIDGSADYGCAIRKSGRVLCWGTNLDGRVGDGTLKNATKPVLVRDLESATALTVGNRHACAIVKDGIVKCWGNGRHGQRGILPKEKYF